MADAVKWFVVRVTAGEHTGWFAGHRFSGGLVTNPDVQKNPPVNLPGTDYALWAQERAATRFVSQEAAEARTKLKAVGYETEVLEIG